MSYKNLSVIKIFITFFIFIIVLSGSYFFYIFQISKTKSLETQIKTLIIKPTIDSPITCNQNGKAYIEDQKYTVTLITNYSDASWTILNNLNCMPLAGSGSIFSTSCIDVGSSTATVSFGGLQNTCQFSTIP